MVSYDAQVLYQFADRLYPAPTKLLPPRFS